MVSAGFVCGVDIVECIYSGIRKCSGYHSTRAEGMVSGIAGELCAAGVRSVTTFHQLQKKYFLAGNLLLKTPVVFHPLDFLCGGRTAQDFIAMGVSTKTVNDRFVLDLEIQIGEILE